jgi:hypothetical protein
MVRVERSLGWRAVLPPNLPPAQANLREREFEVFLGFGDPDKFREQDLEI